MASVSLGAMSFLSPASLHQGTPTQPQPSSHHQILQLNKGQTSSPNITVSFSNHNTMTQGMNMLEEEDVGESKLEIIEESQEEASPKETDFASNIDKECIFANVKKNILVANESKLNNGTRMRSCLMDVQMSSKEAVESLLLLGQGAVVADDALDAQTGIRQRAASMSHMPSRLSTSNTSSIQEERLWGNGGNSYDSEQNTIRQRASSMSSAFHSRSRPTISASLSAYSSPLSRRYSSASSCDTISEPGAGDGTDMRNSYYQRMRERNNEASKRCRLKRRIKYETMESQGNMLGLNNRWLKQRVARLDGLVSVLREGVYAIRTSSNSTECNDDGKVGCKCTNTIASLKQINESCKENECFLISNSSLNNSSKRSRDKNSEFENEMCSEGVQGTTGPRMSSGFASPADGVNQNFEAKHPSSLTLCNNNLRMENRMNCVTEKLVSIKGPPFTLPNADSVMVLDQSVSLKPQPILLRKDIPSFSAGSSSITLPGRCELSVTPLIKPLIPRTFPSTMVSPMAAPNPVTVVSVSPQMISNTLPLSRAVMISHPGTIATTTIKEPPAVTIIKTETIQKPSLTALDVLNETIVKSFDASSNPGDEDNIKQEKSNTVASEFPLNLIKNTNPRETVNINGNETVPLSFDINQKEGISLVSGVQTAPKHLIIHVGKNATNGHEKQISLSQAEITPIKGTFSPNARLLNPLPPQSVVVKCEPDFSIVECKSSSANKCSTTKHQEVRLPTHSSNKLYSSNSCIASRTNNILCSNDGHNVDLNKLMSYIDIRTNRHVKEEMEGIDIDSNIAMEKHIIKSRLKLPFGAETHEKESMSICNNHRHCILNNQKFSSCAMCGQFERLSVNPSPDRSNNSVLNMDTSSSTAVSVISHRFSSKHYNATGNVLPIGSLVCLLCKQNNFTEVRGTEDTSNTILPSVMKNTIFPNSSKLTSTTGSFSSTETTQLSHSSKALNNNSVVISVVPPKANSATNGAMQVQHNSQLASVVSQTSCIANESLCLKREYTPSSTSLLITPQQAPAIKIQRLPIQQTSNQLLLNCNSLTSKQNITKKHNESGPVNIQAISRVCSTVSGNINEQEIGNANDKNKIIFSSVAHPSSNIHLQTQVPALDTNISVQKLNKINQLNEALIALNPRYKPIGFSITSMESCSPNVLEDAIEATETAVTTLMSVIAPGQESFLWNEIRKRLDDKLIPDCNKFGSDHNASTENEPKTMLNNRKMPQ